MSLPILDALAKLLAEATRTRSAYTGGHSDRVPEIALALLDATIATQTGPFADFALTASERETFRLAAWLHDCGKLLCADPILDKATKLEAVQNRIHEIRTRFEVLWRDIELDYWRELHAGGDAQALDTKRRNAQQTLQEEFDFIARVNTGNKPLHAGDHARLRAIGARTWTPYFDRSLGLSREEQMRQAEGGIASLPARERLLADRPEHVVPWGDDAPPVTRDDPRNHWGFDMQLPPHAAHHGELHNLGVLRGTLNDAERFHAHSHAVHTMTMLSTLPLSGDFAALPALAANHHERPDGSGYPRRLRGDALGIPDRILAIADIFEALTANDRPYKPPYSLAQTLETMQGMVRAGHIDADLFALFLRSGVYRRYVDLHLPGEPVLDVETYLDVPRNPQVHRAAGKA
ncbi:HD-GYP domain-containing protein [Pigmentiphaga aceris]|nr:HD domain-containing phosphohydrolase [Pigmentiphaga aceris]